MVFNEDKVLRLIGLISDTNVDRDIITATTSNKGNYLLQRKDISIILNLSKEFKDYFSKLDNDLNMDEAYKGMPSELKEGIRKVLKKREFLRCYEKEKKESVELFRTIFSINNKDIGYLLEEKEDIFTKIKYIQDKSQGTLKSLYKQTVKNSIHSIKSRGINIDGINCCHKQISVNVSLGKKGRTKVDVHCSKCKSRQVFMYSSGKMTFSDNSGFSNMKPLISSFAVDYDNFLELEPLCELIGRCLDIIYSNNHEVFNELLTRKSPLKILNPIIKIIKDCKNLNYIVVAKSEIVRFDSIEFKKSNVLPDSDLVIKEIETHILYMLKKANEQAEKEKEINSKLSSLDSSQITLKAIKSTQKEYGKSTYAKVLKGSKDKKLLEYNLTSSKFYGLLSNLKILEIQSIINNLEDAGLLEVYFSKGDTWKYPKIKLTNEGLEVLKDKDVIVKKEERSGTFLDLENFKTATHLQKIIILKEINISELETLDSFLYIYNFFMDNNRLCASVNKEFIDLLSNASNKFVPILEMNYNLMTGVRRQKIKKILDRIDEKENGYE